MVFRISKGLFTLSELFVSSVIHLIYGLYIFSTAVAADLSQTLIDSIKPNCNNGDGKNSAPNEEIKRAEAFSGTGPVPPTVLVHGIFGFGKGRLGGLSYFAGAEKKDEFVLVPDLGSLTSIHDRARELFYYLKGGRVDYGEEHSKIFGHSRFGKLYEKGHYSEWDENHPIHFVGHSAGAQVVRVLQQMLHDKEFEGPEDFKSMKPICLLQLCRLGVILYDFLNITWLKNYYNFGFDHFDLSYPKTGLTGLLDVGLNKSGPFATGDWILPDLTIQGSIKINERLKSFENTFYFSYATKKTRRFKGITVPVSLAGTHPLLLVRILQMCMWHFPSGVPVPYKGYRDEDWEENDGALNTISMTHPRLPVEHPSHLVVNDSDYQPLWPGMWYYKIVEADHIYFVINRERAGVQFDLIYDSIFRNCRKNMFRKSPQPTLPNHTTN